MCRANCFNAVQLYWQDIRMASYLGPEDFVRYLEEHFIQLQSTREVFAGDVTVVWSRTSDALENRQIKTDHLIEKAEGYPFGLVIEHAYTHVSPTTFVFQKRDPSADGPYEVVAEREALAPYRGRGGFELTRHRRRSKA